jgi:menaquinone-dependent protoporphyrinogen IX oxidase
LGKILVIYDSGYGATEDAAGTVAATLAEKGLNVDLRIAGLEDLVGYDAAIIGSPIRLGHCSPKIKRFLKKNYTALKSMKLAFFFTCMSVTNDELEQELPLYIDPSFSVSNKPRARIKLMENNHTASYYLKNFLKLTPGISVLGISFFKGRLKIGKLSIFHRLVMRFAMFALPEIQNGDYLDHVLIRDWVERISTQLKFA